MSRPVTPTGEEIDALLRECAVDPAVFDQLDAWMEADPETRLPVVPRAACAACQGPLPGRRDAVYCSNACRQRAYRQRRRRQAPSGH